VHRAETKGQVGKLVRKFHVDKWVTENTPKIRKSFAKAAGPAVSIGRRIVTGIAGLVTVLVLTFLMLLEAPGMIRGFLNALPPKRAEHVRRVGADAARSVSGYVVGNLATSMIAGVVVFVTLLILHVPFASLFGVWVAMVDLLPLVGGLLAGVPTVAFAFLHSVSAGIVSAVVFLIYQQIENHILNPIIMSRTVRLNPLWVLLSVLVGADLLGFVGALLAIPIAGAIQVVARDFWDARRGRPKSTPTTGEAAST
jgi:predicted PurR-regulated permease PerM